MEDRRGPRADSLPRYHRIDGMPQGAAIPRGPFAQVDDANPFENDRSPSLPVLNTDEHGNPIHSMVTSFDQTAIHPMDQLGSSPAHHVGKINFDYVRHSLADTWTSPVQQLSEKSSGEKDFIILDTSELKKLVANDNDRLKTNTAVPPTDSKISKFQFYSEKSGIICGDSFASFGPTIVDFMKSGPFWLDICPPDAEDMKFLENAFGIHPLTTEDILSLDTREKIEIYNEYFYLNIRGLVVDAADAAIEGLNVNFLLASEFVISCHEKPVFDLPHVLKRINRLRFDFSLTTDWLMYAIIDNMIDLFLPVVNASEFEIDSIDELVLVLNESEQSDMLRRIWSARKRTTLLYRLLYTKPEILKNLALRAPSIFHQETLIYFRDIQDHVITMVQDVLHYQEILKTAHSTYLSQIDIEINRSSRKLGFIMKKLTAVATILLPLTLVSGLFGMNVHVPGSEVPGDPAWFWVIVGCMLGFSLFMGVFGTRWQWF